MSGGQQLYASLREIAQHKPVVAVMRTVAASGGYMAALGADYLVAERGTLTGSIGVMMQSMEFTELAEKIGATPTTFKSDPLKASPSPFEKITPQVRVAIDSIIEDSYQQVFGDVGGTAVDAAGRSREGC